MANTPGGILLRHIRKLLALAGPGARELPDQQLLERFIQRHDELAFETLVQRHGPLVLGVCRRVLGHEHDAEDAFQATFLVLAQKAASIRKLGSVSSWLYGVANRIAAKARMNAAKRRSHESQSASLPTAEPGEDVSWRELRSVLDEELQRLPERYRAPLVLCYLEGKTQDEAALELDWMAGSVKGRLERGRDALRARLSRRGITLSAALLTTELARKAAVQAALLDTTVRTATLMVAGQVDSALISVQVARLAAGATRAMLMTKVKVGAALFLVASMAAAGTGMLAHGPPAPKQPQEEPPKGFAKAADRLEPAKPNKTRTDPYGDPLPPGVLARMGTVRFHHGDAVTSVAFAPDGETLASVSYDNTLRLWSVPAGKERFCIEDNLGEKAGFLTADAMVAVAFAPDGKTVATAGLNRPIRIWDPATGKLLRRLGGPMQRQALWLAFSPNGKTLAYDGRDLGTLLAEVATGQEVLQLQWAAHCAAFSPDGRTLALGSDDGKAIALWEVATGAQLGKLESHEKYVRCLVFSADGSQLISGGDDKTIRFWDVATLKELRKLTLDGKGDSGPLLVLSRDGKQLISAQANLIQFWDLATGKELHRFQTRSKYPLSLALSLDGKKLALGCLDDRAVRLWEVPTGKPFAPNQAPEPWLRAVAFSPDGLTLATGGSGDDIRVWEAATGRQLHRFATLGRVAFTPDGRTLIGGGWEDGKLHLWDLATGQEQRCFQAHEGWIPCIAAAPDGKTFVSLGGGDQFVRLWDLATCRQIHDFGGKQKSFVTWAAYTTDSKTLATLHQNEVCLRLWDVATARELYRLVGHQKEVASLAVSPDGQTLASGGYDGVLSLWDKATGAERWHGKIGSSLDEMAFAPDGYTVAWGSQHEKTIHLLEVRTHQERHRLRGHHGGITGLAFSADNTRLASTSNEGTAMVWDLTSSQSQRDRPVVQLSREELDQLLTDLGDDAARAHQAMIRLWTAPAQAVALVRKNLGPMTEADTELLARLIRDLDNNSFAVREEANKELDQLGLNAEPAMRRALQHQPTPEVAQRLKKLLAKCESLHVLPSRAVEMLEKLGSTEARGALAHFAQGAPEARLTQEAKASLERVAKRRVDGR